MRIGKSIETVGLLQYRNYWNFVGLNLQKLENSFFNDNFMFERYYERMEKSNFITSCSLHNFKPIRKCLFNLCFHNCIENLFDWLCSIKRSKSIYYTRIGNRKPFIQLRNINITLRIEEFKAKSYKPISFVFCLWLFITNFVLFVNWSY